MLLCLHITCHCCCLLACSYNAEGGGGTGKVQQLPGNKLQLTFDAEGTQCVLVVTSGGQCCLRGTHQISVSTT